MSYLRSFEPHSAACAAPPPVPQQARGVTDYVDVRLAGPSALAASSLTAIPLGTALQRQAEASARRKKKTRRPRLVQEGQIVSRAFNEVASRPLPTMGLGLDQSIVLTMNVESLAFLTTSATVITYATKSFQLSDFNGASSLVTVFDQYRFRQIEVWLEPHTAQGSTVYSGLATAVDLDDVGTPTNIGQVSDKQGAIFGSGANGRYHKWLPHMAVAAYAGAFTSYANMPADWIDSNSPGVQHYGFKAASYPTSVANIYDLYVRAVIEFRAPGVN